MNNTINLDLKGHIDIFNEDELIYSDHNDIGSQAINIILYALTTNQDNYGIDTLRVVTGTNITQRPITQASVNRREGSVTFTAILVEDDIEGNITQLYLYSKKLERLFSEKIGLNITKDLDMRLKISWKITINKS